MLIDGDRALASSFGRAFRSGHAPPAKRIRAFETAVAIQRVGAVSNVHLVDGVLREHVQIAVLAVKSYVLKNGGPIRELYGAINTGGVLAHFDQNLKTR